MEAQAIEQAFMKHFIRFVDKIEQHYGRISVSGAFFENVLSPQGWQNNSARWKQLRK